MTIIPEKYTTPGRKAINARVAAVAFCAAGGGLALLLGSAGWALAGLLVWALSAIVAFSTARSTKGEVSGPASSATSLDEAAILTYLKNNPDSVFAAEVAEALRADDNDKVSE